MDTASDFFSEADYAFDVDFDYTVPPLLLNLDYTNSERTADRVSRIPANWPNYESSTFNAQSSLLPTPSFTIDSFSPPDLRATVRQSTSACLLQEAVPPTTVPVELVPVFPFKCSKCSLTYASRAPLE